MNPLDIFQKEAPEVAKAFPNEKAVNEALKLVIKLKQVQENASQNIK